MSALVTLFANILQNPQDARARTDLKLMSSVVSFLTMLERDVSEANGNVRRMLSICAEFERIARVALDKAEREMRGRGKRKQAERERDKALKERVTGEVAQGLEEGKSLEQMQVETQAAYRRPVQTPSLRASVGGSQAGSNPGNSPASWGGSPPGGNGPEYQRSANNAKQQQSMQPGGQQQSPYMPSQSAINNGQFNPMQFNMPNGMDFNNGSPHQQHPQQGAFTQAPPMDGFQHPTGFSPQGTSAPDFAMPFDPSNSSLLNGASGSFQQPFVPQDLWQMPMTLEWDWAEGLGLGSFTPGPMFEGAAAGYPEGPGPGPGHMMGGHDGQQMGGPR